MQRFLRLYAYLNILSIDIAVGAVISALFFARILNVHLLPYGVASLAITVWIIYTADHLRDALVIETTASSQRHRFHQQHFRQLIIMLVVAVVVDLVLILYARKPVFRWGINLSSIVLIYLVIQRYLKFLKEVFIAVLYTCGVLLPSVTVTEASLHVPHFLLFTQFACVALINLLIFSWYDYETDLADKQRSFATILGKDKTQKIIYAMELAVPAIWSYLFFSNFERLPTTIILVMGLLHLVVLHLFNMPKVQRAGYRLAADAIFFLPIFYLL